VCARAFLYLFFKFPCIMVSLAENVVNIIKPRPPGCIPIARTLDAVGHLLLLYICIRHIICVYLQGISYMCARGKNRLAYKLYCSTLHIHIFSPLSLVVVGYNARPRDCCRLKMCFFSFLILSSLFKQISRFLDVPK